MISISFLAAFLAGILSFASPCLFGLIPAYVGYLGGTAASAVADPNGKKGNPTPNSPSSSRWRTFSHAVAFVLGFGTVFVALGASASFLGVLLGQHLRLVQVAGGLLLVLLGLHTMGILRIPALYMERRLHFNPSRRLGYLSSFLVGVIFATGWTPCVGPILGGILFLATGEAPSQGVMLLSIYTLGLGLPFLLTGLAFERMSGLLRRLNRTMHFVSLLSGVFLLAVGFLLITNNFLILSRFGNLYSDIETALIDLETKLLVR